MLEQRWEILRHYFENRGTVAECVQKLRTDFRKREAPPAPYVLLSCGKSERNWHPHR